MDVISNHTCLQAQNSEIHIISCDEKGMETRKYISMHVLQRNGEELCRSLRGENHALPQFSKGYQSISVKGTKGKTFLPKLYFLAHKSHPGKIFFSLSIPSPTPNLYIFLQFPSTSFTKYIIMYSFPEATISRHTFPQSGNFSNKLRHLDFLLSIYLVLGTHW